jgi:hypothetical protein
MLAGKAYFPNGQADTGFLSAIKHNIYIKVKLYKVLLVSVSSETHRGVMVNVLDSSVVDRGLLTSMIDKTNYHTIIDKKYSMKFFFTCDRQNNLQYIFKIDVFLTKENNGY